MVLVFCDVKCLFLGIVLCGFFSGDVASTKTTPPPKQYKSSHNLPFDLILELKSEAANITFSFKRKPLSVGSIELRCNNTNTGEKLDQYLAIDKNVTAYFKKLIPSTNYSCIMSFTDSNENETGYPFEFSTKSVVENPLGSVPLLRTAGPGKVVSLEVTQTEKVVQINWEPPLPADSEDIISNYTIEVIATEPAYEVPSDCQNMPMNLTYHHQVVNSSTKNVIVPLDIYPYYNYNIVVTASSSRGLGEPEIQKSLFGTPGLVRNLEVDSGSQIKQEDTFAYNLTWKIPCSSNGNITEYNVKSYGKSKEKDSLIHERNEIFRPNTSKTTALTYKLDDLIPCYNYRIEVAAVSGNLTGKFAYINFTIPSLLPAPLIVNVTSYSEVISLFWRESRCLGEIVNWIVEIKSLGPEYQQPEDCEIEDNYSNGPLSFSNYTTNTNISSLNPNTRYRISVSGNTSAGISESATVMAQTTAHAPGIVRNLNVDSNSQIKYQDTFSYNLTWKMPCNPNGLITKYVINIYDTYSEIGTSDQADENIFILDRLETTELNYILNFTKPSHIYTIEVAAVSGNLTGMFTYINFTTPSQLPAPPNVTFMSQAKLITVSWSVSKRMEEIVNWTVEIKSLGPMYKQPDYCEIDNYNKTLTFPRDETTKVFSSLNPYTRYNISVSARNAAGLGQKTTVTAETSVLVPDKVNTLNHNFSREDTEGIWTNITWRQPCFINGPLKNTTIKISGHFSEEHDNDTRIEFAGTNSFLVTRLNYSYQYTITIWLVLEDEQLGREGDYNLETPPGLPGKVISLNVTQKDNNSFEIHWEPPLPAQRRGIITKYTIRVIAKEPAYEVASHCHQIPKNINYTERSTNGSTRNMNYSLKQIYKYYYYDIVVTAASSKGLGEPETRRIISLPGVPDSVELKDAIISNKPSDDFNATAAINFRAPCFLNGRLINYTLIYGGNNAIHYPIPEKRVIITIDGYNLTLLQDVGYYYYITTFTGESNNIESSSSGPKMIKAEAGVPQINLPVDLTIEKNYGKATLKIHKTYFNQTKGEVRYLAVMLANSSQTDQNPKKFTKVKNNRNEEWPEFSETDKMNLKAIKRNPFKADESVDLVVGNGIGCPVDAYHCNESLKPDTEYNLVVRVYTTSFYRNSGIIHFKTDSLSYLDIILGILFGILFVVLVAFVTFYLWRRKIIKIPHLPIISRKASDQQCVAIRTSYPPKKFVSYFKHLENNPDILNHQFLMIKERSAEYGVALKTNYAKLPENRRKNRYTNISPYDETRVKLMIDEDDEIGSDYINASYIRGYTGEVEYIATQGPLDSTCRDFWKMILQENVSIIVMVSLLVEQDKVKCHRYFPKNHETMIVGEDIEIKCSIELHFGTYCVRSFQIRKDNLQTQITHMQLLEWPDFGVPKCTEHMLQFCYQIRDRIEIEEGIIVVHCSAGVGRTGTWIATDILLQTANAGRNIDVFNTVQELRKQRMSMVQTQEQYMYIHKLITEHICQPRTPDDIHNQAPIYENQSIINSNKNWGDLDEEEAESKF